MAPPLLCRELRLFAILDAFMRRLQLTCWALVEVSPSRGGPTETAVIGMDGGSDPDVDFVDECSNFRRYAHAEREADLELAKADDRRAA